MEKTDTETSNGVKGTKAATEIASFVFLDLEATSLLEGGQKPRITEISFLAVSRASMHDAVQRRVTPRVVNKLTLCLDPIKLISHAASNITGLFNDSLEFQKPLSDKTVLLINNFMEHLAHPICLLSHNGNSFDFPLLLAEVKRVKGALLDDILCADTLEAFRSLDGLPARYNPLTNQNHCISHQSCTPKSTQIVWERPPALKRKISSGETDIQLTAVKVNKQSLDQFDNTVQVTNNVHVNQEADKVKKKLFLDEQDSQTNKRKQTNKIEGVIRDKQTDKGQPIDSGITSSVEKAEMDIPIKAYQDMSNDEQNQNAEHNLTETSEENLEQFDEFTSSFEDSELISVLEDVENEHCKTGKKSRDTEQGFKNGNMNKIDQAHVACDNLFSKLSDVENSSGYFIVSPSSSNTVQSSKHIHITTCTESSTTPAAGHSASSASKSCVQSSVVVSSLQSSSSITSANITPSAVTSNVTPTRPNVSPSVSSKSMTPNMSTPRLSYKLEEIYLRTFGKKPEISHSAEDDCISMLRVSCFTPGLVSWIDQHAVKLSDVRPAF